MAARYFYVSSIHGTNTGATDTSKASVQTGNITSLAAGDVYDSIDSADAVGSPPIDGDFILVANNSAASHANAVSPIGSTVHTGLGVSVISVDAANVEQYLPGAKETITGTTNDWAVRNNTLHCGVSLQTGDDTYTLNSGGINSFATVRDCTLTATVNGGTCITAGLPGRGRFYNVVLETTNTGAIACQIGAGTVYEFYGCSSLSTAQSTRFFNATEGTVRCYGCDWSDLTGTLVGSFGAAGDEEVLIQMYNCQLSSTVTIHNAITAGSPRHRIELYGCDDSTGNDQYRFYIVDNAGTAQNNETTFVTATETWYDGADQSSVQVVTESTCSLVIPFIFQLPAEYVDFSDTASDVLDIYMTSDTALDQADIGIFMIYPDGTTAVIPKIVSGNDVGGGTWSIDPMMGMGLTTGTALTTTTGKWTVPKTNQYKLTLDTSAAAGGVGVPIIQIEVYKASLTVYFDTEISAKA